MRNLKKTVGLFVAATLISAAPALAGQQRPQAALEEQARSARTASQHVAVAKEYRLRAQSFEEQAKKHETEAQKLEARRFPYDRKWPSATRQPWVRERQLAVEARRQATEAMKLADHHARLGLEAIAEAPEFVQLERNDDRTTD